METEKNVPSEAITALTNGDVDNFINSMADLIADKCIDRIFAALRNRQEESELTAKKLATAVAKHTTVSNRKLKEAIFEKLDNLSMQTIIETPEPENENINYADWRDDIMNKIYYYISLNPKRYNGKSNKQVSGVLRQIYRRMKELYGFVSEQLRKEYYRKYETAVISTLELVYLDNTWRSLFEHILDDMIQSSFPAEETTDTETVNDNPDFETPKPVTNHTKMTEAVLALAEFTGDTTAHHYKTYERIYNKMRSEQSWKNLMTRFKKNRNLSMTPSKSKLVQNSDKLTKQFIKTAKHILSEEQTAKSIYEEE